MKRIVICLDGTWNNAAKEVQRRDPKHPRVFKPTNVLKVARATRQSDEHGNLQITYYDTGVGAMNRAPNFRTKVVRWFDNKLGGGWGAGFEVNIEEAYTFLANNFARGDEIFVFGFSRGASQARSLVNLVEWVGGLPEKHDAYYVPMLYTRYLERRGAGSGQELWDERNAKRRREGRPELAPFVQARIRLLGVWDTVLALGSRFAARNGSSAAKYGFHTPDRVPTVADAVRHAIAIDERRHDFQPEIWSAPNDDVLQQRWFAGVHSNVGGGLNRDGLANCALRWMCAEARAAGLAFDEDFLASYHPYPQDEAPGKALMYKVGDFLLRPFRGFRGVRDLLASPPLPVDPTALARLATEVDLAEHRRFPKAYRPKNLLAYLAEHPEYDEELEPHVLALVEKRR